MNKILDNIGFYDFWGVFAPGVITLTLGIIPYYSKIHNVVLSLLKENSLVITVVYILFSYIIGLICHAVSVLLVDNRISGFNIEKATKKSDRKMRWRDLYIINNEEIKDASSKNFFHCYNYVINNKCADRVNKLHSIYGMSRGIATGCLINLFAIVVIYLQFQIKINLLTVIMHIFLFIMFYLRAKRYFYRWIEWVYIEYQFQKAKLGE